MILYIVIHKSTGDSYVGKTKNLVRRWREHRYEALNRDSKTHFHCALRKYGPESFDWIVIGGYDDHESLSLAEINKISELKGLGVRLYNMTEGGDGMAMPTQETRARMGAWQIGRTLSLSHRTNISKAGKGKSRPDLRGRIPYNKGKPSPNKGKPLSADTVAKMKDAVRRRTRDCNGKFT